MKRVVDALNTIANALVSTLLSLSKRELDHAVALNTLTALTNSLNAQDATLAKLKTELREHEQLSADLIEQLNRANARCAALQQALLEETAGAKSTHYWFARVADGTVVGPFSRS